MKNIHEKTIKDLVEENPNLIEYFEVQGIDYCCSGTQTLQHAIEKGSLDATDVLAEVDEILNAAAENSSSTTLLVDPAYLSVSSLIQYITDKHHTFTRFRLDELDQLTEKIAHVHGDAHPELIELRTLFVTFKGELTRHLQKEELYVFPSLIQLEKKSASGETESIREVDALWADIGQEHNDTGEVLVRFQQLTSGYTPPADACDSYQRTFSRLKELTKDIHLHVYLEENVLLPKAQKIYQNLK